MKEILEKQKSLRDLIYVRPYDIDAIESASVKLCDAVIDFYEKDEADQFKNEWVSINDRVPESSGEVLGIMKDTLDQYICFYRPGRNVFEVYGAGADPISDMQVTHWQPLPSPPSFDKVK